MSNLIMEICNSIRKKETERTKAIMSNDLKALKQVESELDSLERELYWAHIKKPSKPASK